MSYPLFLLLYLVVPILILGVWLRREWLQTWWLRAAAFTIVIALVYTTPWDNFLVATQVWYYDPARVWNIILGWVPLEEYLFFVLQTILTGLIVAGLLKREAKIEIRKSKIEN
jgi:lycopene cyclase domain-containing protein